MIKELDFRLRKSDGYVIMHDSRADSQALIGVCNTIIDKVNELVSEVNRIERTQSEIMQKLNEVGK